MQLFVFAGAGLAAFLAAAHLASPTPEDAATVAPTTRGERAAAASDVHAGLPRDIVARAQVTSAAPLAAASGSREDRGRAIPGDTGQPFVSTSWLPPPPPPPKPVVAAAAPPAAPVAPPLPFTFVGLVEKGTPRPQAFLARGEELLVVSQGDVLDNGAYRVDTVTPTQIVFVHVPTNTRQVISLSGGAS